MLHSYQQYLPSSIVGEERTVNEVLLQTLIQTRPDSKGEVEYIPLREDVYKIQSLCCIYLQVLFC